MAITINRVKSANLFTVEGFPAEFNGEDYTAWMSRHVVAPKRVATVTIGAKSPKPDWQHSRYVWRGRKPLKRGTPHCEGGDYLYKWL